MEFKQTCDKPYDRHTYRVHCIHNKCVDFEYYDEARNFWWNATDFCETIEVLDKGQKRGTVKGF